MVSHNIRQVSFSFILYAPFSPISSPLIKRLFTNDITHKTLITKSDGIQFFSLHSIRRKVITKVWKGSDTWRFFWCKECCEKAWVIVVIQVDKGVGLIVYLSVVYSVSRCMDLLGFDSSLVQFVLASSIQSHYKGNMSRTLFNTISYFFLVSIVRSLINRLKLHVSNRSKLRIKSCNLTKKNNESKTYI